MRLAFPVVAALCLVVAPAFVAAEDPPAAGDEVVIDFSKEMRVSDLLHFAAKHLGRPILWQPDDKAISAKKFSGSDGATLRVPKRRMLSVLRALLVPQEVILIPMPVGDSPAYFAMDARSLASQYLLKVRPETVEITEANAEALSREEGLWVSAAISVSNFDTLRDASTALRRLTTANNMGSVQEVPDARMFLVTDLAPNVVQIWRTIRAMDGAVGRRRPRVETIALAHARVEKVLPVLEQLTATPPRPGPEALGSRPRVAADPGMNAVVVIASPEDLETLRAAIEKLDQPEKPR
jgi:hypothetical protein